MSSRCLPAGYLLLVALGGMSVILALSACRREPTEPAGKTEVETEPSEPALISADGKDAPDAPYGLPASDEVPGWVKTEPIRVVTGDGMTKYLPDVALSETARAFNGLRLARCTYTRQLSPEQNPQAVCRAEVWYFEAADPLDAFGLFSLMSHERGLSVRWQDGSMRERRDEEDRQVLLAWQGTACVRIVTDECPEGSEGEPDHLEHLMDRIIFYLPAAEPPVLMRALPAEWRAGSKVWVVRDPRALRWADDVRVRDLSPAELASRLGLTGKPVLMIASIQVGASENDSHDTTGATQPNASTPLLIWVVQYPHEQQAWEAYRRYEVVVAEGRSSRDRATRLLEPVGPFLAGTWTADEEHSLAALAKLRELLPFAVSTHPALTVSSPAD